MTHSANDSDLLTFEGGPKPGTEGVRYGFFTDTTVCIGCKACEVACKEWNGVPENPSAFTGNSYDNTGTLGANAWRHVVFVEQPGSEGREPVGLDWFGSGQGQAQQQMPPTFAGEPAPPGHEAFRWLMSSDVCKHCTEAACLEVCPTGAIFYTEYRTVVVQDDVCNGCGYCVTACPFGVIERREADGGAWKCTLCYDRMRGGKQPACAMACPTDSIQFGPLHELRERADRRLDQVVASGQPRAQLYGESPDGGVGGQGSIFLLLDDPEVYRLPPDPVTPTRHLGEMWKAGAMAATTLLGMVAAAFVGRSGSRA